MIKTKGKRKDLKSAIEKLAHDNLVDRVGFAPIVRFEKAPPHHKPTDFLPEAKTVIVLGINIPKGVAVSSQRAYSPNMRHAIYPYLMYGYVFLNNFLNTVAFQITTMLERKGFTSLPIPASPPNDPYLTQGAFSNRHAAVAAGFGEFGWMTLLITPSGPRIRVVSIITEAEIEPSPLYRGEKICDPRRCNFLCARVCPVSAIPMNKKVSLEIEGNHYEYCDLDKWKCRWGVLAFTKSTLGRKEIAMPEVITPENYLVALKEQDPWQSMEMVPIGRASFCGKCMIDCPVDK